MALEISIDKPFLVPSPFPGTLGEAKKGESTVGIFSFWQKKSRLVCDLPWRGEVLLVSL